jgi:serine/threonine-protein kinase
MGESHAAEGRPLVGDVIAGKYRIEGIAGEGGMGIVYEAEHVILRQRVALKALHPGRAPSAAAIERFSLEASAIARIACEHVVRIMDAGSLPDSSPYLVMEYLDGCDLNQLLQRRGALPAAEAVDFALQALEALAHAHAARVIHRDLKPANLFLATLPGGRQVIKLLDFGISKSFDMGADEERLVGSPVYMSPEQLANAPIDPRTDLWSLGVVLYELVAGAPPFVGSFSELVASILERDAVPLAKRAPTAPSALSEAVAKCLKRDPAARWGSAAELARAIAPHGTGKWLGALERIDRAAAFTAPARAPRKFESLENALQALDDDWGHDRGVETMPLPPEGGADGARSREVVEDTIPAPASNGESPFKVETPSGAPSGSKPALRILLIDDSEITLGLHGHVLTDAGFDVRTTSSAREFDVLVDSFRPHLVLMDVQMPGVSGDVLCRRVKERFRATLPVVFVSDMDRQKLAELARTGGADAFLSKSTNLDAFVDVVRNICAITYSPDHLP